MPNIANAIPITLYMTRLKVEVSTLSLSSLDFVEAFNDFEIKDFVKEQLKNMSSWEIKSISLDGSGMYTTSTYSMPGWNLYVMVPNEETVLNAQYEINSLNN